MKVLLAEDDLRLGKLIMKMLKKEQFTADWVDNGETAYDQALTGDYDVIILDWMLPEKDGIEVSRLLRKEGYSGAILMLTARDALEDRVQGLDSGADDYMMKPFAFEELFARLRSLYRRNFFPVDQNVIRTHDLTIDLTNHLIKKNDELLSLTSREYQLLVYFVKNTGRILSKEMIMSRVWEESSDVTFNTMEAFVKLLRKKLGQSKQSSYIKTIRGLGYMWVDEHV
ncbi:response regulator transcription factor [Sporolactobacillus laevolacticus]|uniref:response regulator transcription factor n=1 Tax=Sporolactobacillus laevolacticus TaxID=33018 RepID=UPI0025B59C4D|nr:response regulator transcription factor [Sporolactobacillus laevolacticus]MDN3956417.1 response regulator transcription factor [Sporolactobacillus laevolacticus]